MAAVSCSRLMKACATPQVSACQSRGLSACYLGSGQRDGTVAPAAWRGDFELVYITPELAANNISRIKSLQASQVHC